MIDVYDMERHWGVFVGNSPSIVSILMDHGYISKYLLPVISGPVQIHHLKQHLKTPMSSERVYQDPYWGTCWFVSVIDVLLNHSPQTLVDMIVVDQDTVTINWKATPKPRGSGTPGWYTIKEPCCIQFKPTRRAVAGNPLMIAGSCGNSSLDLDVSNDNLLVETFMSGFTKLMERELYKGGPDAVSKAYDEMNGDYPHLAVSLFADSYKRSYYLTSVDQLKMFFKSAPMGALFIASSDSETTILVSGHAYSVKSWNSESIELQNPWGRKDCTLDYETALKDIYEVVWFVPPKVTTVHNADGTPVRVNPNLLPQNGDEPPRDNYVLQYWDIMFSATLTIFIMYFNCPKYILGVVPVELGPRLGTIARLFVVPLLYMLGLNVSATWDNFYIPGQHMMLTILGFMYSGMTFDAPDRLFGVFPERTAMSLMITSLIFILILLFAMQLDCVQHFVGFCGYIMSSLIITVVFAAFDFCKKI